MKRLLLASALICSFSQNSFADGGYYFTMAMKCDAEKNTFSFEEITFKDDEMPEPGTLKNKEDGTQYVEYSKGVVFKELPSGLRVVDHDKTQNDVVANCAIKYKSFEKNLEGKNKIVEKPLEIQVNRTSYYPYSTDECGIWPAASFEFFLNGKCFTTWQSFRMNCISDVPSDRSVVINKNTARACGHYSLNKQTKDWSRQRRIEGNKCESESLSRSFFKDGEFDNDDGFKYEH